MNSRFRRHLLTRWLGSVQLMILLTLIFAVSCAVGTFIEAKSGTPAARALVYDAIWFELVIALLVINLIILLFARMPYRPSQLGFVLIHIAGIVILISAGITRFFGYEGLMPIREGQSTDFILSTKDYAQIADGDQQAGFRVRLYKAGAQKIGRELNLGGQAYRVSIDEFWPHYSEAIEPSASGVPGVEMAVAGEGGPERYRLLAGETAEAGGVELDFLAGGFAGELAGAPLGEVQIHYKGDFARLPVSRDPGQNLTLDDLCFNIEEFHPDFARREEQPEPEEMNNPMLRVGIEAADGKKGDRVLFAFFPDFSMGSHGGAQEEAFAEVQLRYAFQRRFELAWQDGRLMARASFPLDIVDMGSGEVDHTQAPGEPFALEEMVLHRAGDFSVVTTNIWPAAERKPSLSEDPNAPEAARVSVADASGHKTSLVVRRSDRLEEVMLGDKKLQLGFGPRRIKLPYRLELDDFELKTYPGSDNPASYESHVRLFDEEQGISGEAVRIYMNYPLTHRGNKHFQSSYDPDRLGTVLSVNHDPGKWPTYIGYMLIGLGFILTLGKRLLWPKASANGKEAA